MCAHFHSRTKFERYVTVMCTCRTKFERYVTVIYTCICRMDRVAQHALEIDAKDKHHAQGLDDRMQSMRNCSAGIGYYPGIEGIDNT